MDRIETSLAIGFGSPWLLSALVLGLIPILLHLLHRRQYRETSWAAMQFLVAASRRHARRLRLERILLLAIRTLILVCLVLALARPYIESSGEFLEAGQPVLRILVIDSSFSMEHRPTNRSTFERAIETARKILSEAKNGDACQIVRLGELEPRVLIRRPAYRTEDVLNVLNQMHPSAERGDLLPTLNSVNQLVSRADQQAIEVYFISDLQQETWWSDDAGRNRDVENALARLDQSARITLVDIGDDRSSNLALTELTAEASLNIVNRPIRLRVAVRNDSLTENLPATVELRVNDRIYQRKSIDLPARQEAPIPFEVILESPGEAVLEARLVPDALVVDDNRWLVLNVKPQVDVLLVDGHGSIGGEAGASFYLATALEPQVDDRTPVLQTRVISDSQFDQVDLHDFDCVVLCDVAVVTATEVARLEHYVAEGGGLVLMPGERAVSEAWNELLYRDGQGVMPGRLGARVGSLERPDRLYRFLMDDLPHPILDPYRGNPGLGLERPLTLSYFRVIPDEDSPAVVVLRFEEKDPAILEQPFGRGRVVLLTSPWDDSRWNTLARRDGDVLVALSHEIVNFVVAQSATAEPHLVGQTFTRFVSRERSGEELRLIGPDQRDLPLQKRPRQEGGTRFSVRFPAPGIYRLESDRDGPIEQVAVNVDPRESDLRHVPGEILRDRIAGGTREYIRGVWQPTLPGIELDTARTAAMARWLLYAVLLFLVIEQFLAWRFRYGILVMAGVVVQLMAMQFASVLPWLPVASLSLLAAGAAVGLCCRTGWWKRSRSRNA